MIGIRQLSVWATVPSYHFITGLPRSGSTLLAAILRQNPRFHAGMTSPVGALTSALLPQFSAGSEYGATITQEQRRRLVRGVRCRAREAYMGGVIVEPSEVIWNEATRRWRYVNRKGSEAGFFRLGPPVAL